MNRRLTARIAGVVQGVGFRYYTLNQALKAGISGYVRNLPDGAVEVEAEGEEGCLEAFIGSLRSGPPGALVDDLKFEWADYTGKYQGFSIKQ
jgi:acylphosphatase